MTGIRRWRSGWQTYVRVNGVLHSRSFPRETTVQVMQDWRRLTVLTHRRAPRSRYTLEADVTRYLMTVRAMPTYRERCYHLDLWIDMLGATRHRHTITTPEIDAVLQEWLVDGLAPSTVKHRRSALLHLWNTLDGRDTPNPVRRSQVPRQPPPAIRGLDYGTVRDILAAIRRPKARARLAVIAWTGLPHKQVMQLTPADVDWDQSILYIQGRQKGRGSPPRVLPLMPEAVEALREFDQLNCWGPFSSSSLRLVFVSACQSLGLSGIRPYDLRHSYGTLIYQATGDQATTADLLGHTDLRMAKRYTLAAVPIVARRAVQKAARLAASSQRKLSE